MTAETITQTQRLRKHLESGKAIVEVRNKYGEKCRVKQYWLVGNA